MGPSFLLMPDQVVLENIKKIVEYAEAHHVDFETLQEMANYGKPGYKGLTPAGINLNNTLKLYDTTRKYYYKTAISIEQMEKVWVRHFSASVSTGDDPNPAVLKTILPFYGFISNDLTKLMVEYIRPVVHIMEPLYMTWKEFSEKQK